MKLAIFDLDETLIGIDSDHAWGDYTAEHGLVNAAEHTLENRRFYEDYKRGKLDIDAYLAFSTKVLTQHPLETLLEHRARFIETVISPAILPGARDLIEGHRDRGDQLVIVTATLEFVTRPISLLLGIEELIAPIPELTDQGYTGKIIGTPSFGAGKVTRLNTWMAEKGLSLAGSTFYSDSHNDLPLLLLVDHPVAVNADPILAQVAKEKGWKCICLS
ncbi:MAG: HAD superfamily hydrolase (TIGR01490 family) [Patiriisocius sp.]